MSAYPTKLPAPMASGYEINPEDATLRTQMDAGPDRVRHRYTAIPSLIPIKWRFTLAEMALFEAWHKYDTLDGSAWFTINLANGKGITTVDARFSKPLKKILLNALKWEVQSELEVRTLPVMTTAEYAAALI